MNYNRCLQKHIYNHAHPDSLTTHASNKTIGVEGVLQFWRAVLPTSFSKTKEKNA